jgi:hypothetical protein
MLRYSYTKEPGALLFIKNAVDIVIDTTSVEKIYSISLKIGESFFRILPQLNPDANGNIRLRTRELLEGISAEMITLQNPCIPAPVAYVQVLYCENKTDSSEWIPLPWIKGGYDSDISGLGQTIHKGWLNWKKDCRTVRWGTEWLYVYVPAGKRLSLHADVTLSSGSCSFDFNSIPILDYNAVRRINVSFQEIRGYCDRWGFDMYDIVDWCISGKLDRQELGSIRYVCEDSSPYWRGFIYRNSLGVFDSLYAKGSVIDKLTYESQVFQNNFLEQEITTHVDRQVETFSGYLDTEEERERWMEFIESSERYILLQDGTRKPIILDGVSCDMKENDSAGLSFTWHLAKIRQGYGAPREDDSSSSSDDSATSTDSSTEHCQENGTTKDNIFSFVIPPPVGTLSDMSDWDDLASYGLNQNDLYEAEEAFMMGETILLTYDHVEYHTVEKIDNQSNISIWSCKGIQLLIDFNNKTLISVFLV